MPVIPFHNPNCGSQNCLQRLSNVPSGANSPQLKTALLHHSYPLNLFDVVSPSPPSHAFPNFHISFYCLTPLSSFCSLYLKNYTTSAFSRFSLTVQFPLLNSLSPQPSGFRLPLWLLHFGLLYQLYLVGQWHNLYFFPTYSYLISSCLSCLIFPYVVSLLYLLILRLSSLLKCP